MLAGVHVIPTERPPLPTPVSSWDPALTRIRGRWHVGWYLLASDGDARRYRVYDLRVRHLGYLDAPYGTNIPHPMVVPVPDGGRTRWLMLTFDGTPYAEPVLGYGTHGDFLVMEAQRG